VVVACSLETHFEFVRAIAGKDEMRVAIDQARRDQTVGTVELLAALDLGRLSSSTCVVDAPALSRDQPVLDHDDASGAARERRQSSIPPDPVNLFGHQISPLR